MLMVSDDGVRALDLLTLTFEAGGKVPLYEQLYSYIKSEIQSGKIAHNTKLPSKRKLSTHLNVSQNTIQAAYDQLIEEGYILAKERYGYYVSKLDHMLHLIAQEGYRAPEQIRSSYEIKCDFSYLGVDEQSFPYTTWRKLSKDAINEYDKTLLKMGHPQGQSDLRRCIAEYLHQSRGVNCTPEQIIISAGTEFLFNILIQLFDRNSVYGLENPGYEKLFMMFSSHGVKFKPVKIDDEGMIPGEIQKNEVDIACLTPAHQFPTGVIMPINRRIQLLNWANESQQRYIIEDDYDSEFKYSGKPIPAMQGLDTNEKVIYMGAFSKSFSPAIRVSYMVLPSHLLKKYHEHLSYFNCPVPIVVQKILCSFIQDGYFERHLNKMRTIYRRKRELIVQTIQTSGYAIEVLGADAGLHLLLRVNNGMTEAQLVNSALENGFKVYGISNYYRDDSYLNKPPLVIVGYAAMTEVELSKAIKKLIRVWF